MGMEAVASTVGIKGRPRRGAAGGEYPPAAAALPAMSGEQERVLLEHLPIMRFLARRIHERLPQHVDIEDLISAGVVGLMDAFAKFDSTKKCNFAATRNSASGERFWIACGHWTGARASCAAKAAPSKRRFVH
jgi:hypothetical protein